MKRALVAVSLSVLVAASIAVMPDAHAAPPALPVAWKVTSPSTLNQPALTPTGLVTTAGRTATARELAHGTVQWASSIPEPEPHFSVTLGAPTVHGAVVDAPWTIVVASGLTTFALTNGKATVGGTQLHAIIGQLVVDGPTSTRVQGSFSSGPSPYVTYDLPLGDYRWLVSFNSNPVGLPALFDGRAFVPAGELVGVDPAQGCPDGPIQPPYCLPTWRVGLGGSATTPARISATRIVTSDSSGVVTALNAKTGKVVWATPSVGKALGGTAFSNGVVYVGAADGTVRALDAATGALRWKKNVGAPIRTAPTVSNGRVYFATDNGKLFAFNAAGCGAATCNPVGAGNANLPGTKAAGAPLVRNHTAVVAYATTLVAFTV